jgi:hypothetical protein
MVYLKLTTGEVQLRQQARREDAPQLRLGQLCRELLPLLQHTLQIYCTLSLLVNRTVV